LSRAVRCALLGGRSLCFTAGLSAAGFVAGSNDAVAAPFPSVIELRSLHPGVGGDGSQGFILKGIDAFDLSGGSVSDAGDVNGDQIDDLIIGAYDANPGDPFRAGESYVVFGRTTGFPAAFELHALLPALGGDGSEGFILEGIDPEDFSGRSVSGAGDVNGDGIDDLLIGAFYADPNGRLSGESYVVFGRTSAFPARSSSVPSTRGRVATVAKASSSMASVAAPPPYPAPQSAGLATSTGMVSTT